MGGGRVAKSDLQSVYASLVGVLTKRLHDRLKGLEPVIARA